MAKASNYLDPGHLTSRDWMMSFIEDFVIYNFF